MSNSVFESPNYKTYLQARLGAKNQRRGSKSKAAAALGCQPTYISQVLHGGSDLSLEQADRMSAFLGHSEEESSFFMNLILRDRAGTPSLRRHFSKILEEIQQKRMNLTQRLGKKERISEKDQSRYYCSWHFAALHIALTIPALQTSEALKDFFRLPLKKVNSVLDFLVQTGLAVKTSGGKFQTGSTFVRLGNDSPNILRHHSNWRQLAIDSLDREEMSDLHYSAVVSLSKSDVLKLKNRLLEEIAANISLVQDSKEEVLYSYSLDFFNLQR